MRRDTDLTIKLYESALLRRMSVSCGSSKKYKLLFLDAYRHLAVRAGNYLRSRPMGPNIKRHKRLVTHQKSQITDE